MGVEGGGRLALAVVAVDGLEGTPGFVGDAVLLRFAAGGAATKSSTIV